MEGLHIHVHICFKVPDLNMFLLYSFCNIEAQDVYKYIMGIFNHDWPLKIP